jgi:class 3 adenylate cyclase
MSTTTFRATAILKTDLAGSTPRFRELPEADLAAPLSEHRALLTRIATTHEGHVVKPEGDGFWLAFPSVTVRHRRRGEDARRSEGNTVGSTTPPARLLHCTRVGVA